MSAPSRVAAALAELIALDSVASAGDGEPDRSSLARVAPLLARHFPRAAAALEPIPFDECALCYRLAGHDQSKEPILLTAHFDVVPADPEGWRHAPFAGTVDDDGVHGRGALDDKGSLVSIVAAVDRLVADGFTPVRDLYLAFGGDEETGGLRGAARIARWFEDHGITFACMLDEGSAIVERMLPSLRRPVALIGCGEKGHANIEVHVTGGAGHAAAPPRAQAGAILARALHRILRRRLPVHRIPLVSRFVRELGRTVGGTLGAVLRFYPVTAPIVDRVLAGGPETDAMLRTTVALTVLGGSSATNVLPGDAWANLNVRLLPGVAMTEAVEALRRRVADPRVEVRLSDGWDNNDAPPSSSPDTRWFAALSAALRDAYGPVSVIPYLITATTDSHHYRRCARTTYRFVPMRLGPEQLATIHGTNEWISHDNLARMVTTYAAFIRYAAAEEEWNADE